MPASSVTIIGGGILGLAVAGLAIGARGDIGEVGLLDLAPTFLSLLGEPVPECMTGSVLTPLLRGVEVPS